MTYSPKLRATVVVGPSLETQSRDLILTLSEKERVMTKPAYHRRKCEIGGLALVVLLLLCPAAVLASPI